MSSASTTPLKSFSDLPPEIRCQIWSLSLLEERIVPFRVSINTHTREIPGIYSFRALPPPNLLHVCHESRQETLRYFRQGSWRSEADPAKNPALCGYSRGWWNLSMDIIYVPYWLPPNDLPPGVESISTMDAKRQDLNIVYPNPLFRQRMKDIQHFACSMKGATIRWQWDSHQRAGQSWNWNWMASWLQGLPNLKILTWIVDYTTYRYKKDGPQWIDHPDFPVEGAWRNHSTRWDMTPSKIRSGLQESFAFVKSVSNDPDWKVPQVRIVLDVEDQEECLRREQRYRKRETDVVGREVRDLVDDAMPT
ncbi:hypothetical protein MFRU_025g00750 [Monilinia fructicola]|nr:hypothetical protein MFRU_025g00750 [Monilinia fructicola]